MRNLNTQEIKNISGALCCLVNTEDGQAWAVTDDSAYMATGYTYYAFHVVDQNGSVVFQGDNGSFQTIYGNTIYVRPSEYNGSIYLNLY